MLAPGLVEVAPQLGLIGHREARAVDEPDAMPEPSRVAGGVKSERGGGLLQEPVRLTSLLRRTPVVMGSFEGRHHRSVTGVEHDAMARWQGADPMHRPTTGGAADRRLWGARRGEIAPQ